MFEAGWRSFTGIARLPSGVVLVLATAVACGFHPRGSLVDLDDPGRLFLDADRGLSVEDALQEALRERDFVIAANRDEADIVLRVSGERESQRIVSVRSTGRVSEFELSHAVRLAVFRPDAARAEEGASDAAPRSNRVAITREYTYDESQVLGKQNEARILREEMKDELVRQIVLRMVASLARRETEPTEPDGTPDTLAPDALAPDTLAPVAQ